MSIFQTLFNLFLTSIDGSASFHIGRINIGVATISGKPEVVLSLGTTPSSPPSSAH
jgi:hypothetical protein